jgi:hypothetical protein
MKNDAPDLYVVQMAVTGDVKVGRTANIENRLQQLQNGVPHALKLLLHLPGQGSEERGLHDRLKPFRTRGEWFTEDCLPCLPDEMYEMIEPELLDWWRD